MTLTSNITLSGHVNISIIGYNNPTIKCSDGGGLKFTDCHNCTIEGITWYGCGAENFNCRNIPVIEFYHSTNITIQNCTFQHSVGQTVVLLEVSGNAIHHCNFLHNKLYKGHGTTVYCSSNNLQKVTQQVFTISNTNFSNNEGTKRIVYIDQCSNKSLPLLIKELCIWW